MMAEDRLVVEDEEVAMRVLLSSRLMMELVVV